MNELKQIPNVIMALNSMIASSGNTWIPEYELLKQGISKESIAKSVNVEKSAVCCKVDGTKYLTTKNIATAENEVAFHALRILHGNEMLASHFYLDKAIKRAESKLELSFDKQQIDAICAAILNNLIVITGGPGTGKTCVLNGIHFVLSELDPNLKIAYYAPTGKAASRITESTGQPAMTLNRGLGLKETSEQMQPSPLLTDVVIVDEISMLDIFMAAALLKSVNSKTKLILVGDIDQIPSVGPGAVLRDFIESGVIPVVKLTKTFRQKNKDSLFQNIQYIKKGYSFLEEGEDFHVKYVQPKAKIKYSDIYFQMEKDYEYLAKKYGQDQVVCLMPYRKAGTLCSNEMNRRLQNKMNPCSPAFKWQDMEFRLGDPVIQLKNRLECANGDVGKVVKIDTDGVVVRYIDITVKYTGNEMEQITLAYAMSIHKSQGSEYKGVVTCLFSEHKTMLIRNLLYTAITRAKTECILWGDQPAVEKAIRTDGSDRRFTMLTEKLVYQKNKFKLATGL